ncbi:uncharacterized protein EI90DRAFT_3146096 [Cantharellus anzutake]|uniref:uncharacterized protein n=1 Tax=Cantharellus anzutake TaxID=1750568 RepID=UPI001903CCB2|nr:uncharacterized protein EI90DRAFT_3146096 [Cantharellus anzutake]KAF8328897.1 hypothetical protein EI90DRAFT_3146096 [Cantharellus anzutake]
MASAIEFLARIYRFFFPPTVPKDNDALKIGILGAAKIAPYSIIYPSRSHSGVVIEGWARASAFAKKHGIPRVFKNYQDLLNDPSIDIVYNPFEWTMKALEAGKHVLLEKPSGNTAEETIKMFEFAQEKNLVLLEAFHYRFHPAIQTVKNLVDSGVIGKITGADAEMAVPNIFSKDDIRYQYELGGGATMDLGYRPNRHLHDARVDRSLRAIFDMSNDVTSSIYCDFSMPKRSILGPLPFFRWLPRLPTFTVNVLGDEGEIHINNFLVPTVYHSITITKGKETETIKAYTGEKLPDAPKGEAWWSTYRWQLEAFVDKVKNRTPQTWVTPEDSVANMKVIDELYDASGLGKRPASSYLQQY